MYRNGLKRFLDFTLSLLALAVLRADGVVEGGTGTMKDQEGVK